MIALLVLLAGPPDTLRLGPGIHPGPLILTRPTVVLGAPGAILRGDGKGSVVEIVAPGSVVRGLRIEGSGRDLDRDDAAILVRADSVTLEDLVLRDMLYGVYLREVRDVNLRRLDIEGPAGLDEGAMGDGIHFYHSRHVVAEDNRIRHVRDGMYFSYSDSLLVTGNHVSRVRFGLHYMFSHWNRFEHNVFTDNAAGAVIMNSNGVIIRGNVFAWNAGSRSYGLILQSATQPRVEDNVLVGNGIGVFFDNVIRGRFTGNLVARNWLGFQLFTNSEATEITGNAIAANTFDVTGGGGAGAYRFCVHGQGNYWEQATNDGYDLNEDGRLDTPHDASSPLAELARDRDGLRLFLQSPAARALEWAEHTFPVFDVQQAVDSCPLRHPLAPAMLASLPASREGAEGSARNALAVSGLVLAAGIAILALPGRRRA